MSLNHRHPLNASNRERAHRTILSRAIQTAALSVLLTGTVHAAEYAWDANAAAAGTGGTGTWASPAWTLDGTTFVTWPGAGNTALFGGTAGTVTVGTQTANGLRFDVGGYSLGGGTLTLAGTPAITTNGGTTTFANTLNLAGAGGVAITKTGAGTLSLATANGSLGTAANPASWTVTGGAFSGGLFDSVLSVEFGSNLGAAPSAAATQITLNAGTLQIRGAGSSTAGTVGPNRRLVVGSAGGAISDISGGPNYYYQPIVNNAAANTSLYVTNTGGTAQFTGLISGTGSVTWNGAGAMSVTRANTFSGGLVINNGVVELTNGAAAGTGTITVNDGGELSSLGSQVANAITVNTGGTLAWDFFSDSGDYTGPVTLAGDARVALSNFYGSGAMSGSISGNLSGPGSLTTTATNKTFTTGGGRLILKGTNNTYSGGTVIGRGTTLQLGTGSGLGSGGLTINGGTFDTGDNNVTVPTLTATSVPSGTQQQSAGYAFRLNAAGTPSTLTVNAQAAITGGTGVAINATAATGVSLGTYPLISATGGLGGNVHFAGGEFLTVPANSVIQRIAGTDYRLTLNPSDTGISLTVAAAPSKMLAILPLGSSITAGQSAQNPYNGGGYRTQLYQNLVNDGRFNPQFVGSATTSLANNPTGPNLLTTVGQTRHEGHPGYTTTQVLANLDGADTSGGNNGGNWLAAVNGANPDYITLNIGGNDFFANYTDTTAINRLDTILTKIAQLRPNATIVVSSIITRTDGQGRYANGDAANPNGGFNNLYNPLIPALVYKHVLAGEKVSFLDLASQFGAADLSSDGIHPTQAAYNRMADAWYNAITKGQAFYTGQSGQTWNASAGGATNWAMDFSRTTDSGVAPGAGTDVYFNGGGSGTSTLGRAFSVRSVNFTAGQTAAVTIGGTDALTIGSGGVTVQAGTAAHTISAPVVLGAKQTWSNVSANEFAVSGAISGSGPLTLAGGTFRLSGANSYTAATTIQSGVVKLGPDARTPVISGGGVDLQGGTLQFEYLPGQSPAAAVKALLDAAAPGRFASGQIRSTTLPAGQTLGYGDNGQAVTVRITLPGDADLNGQVNFNDFLVLQNNFGNPNTRFDQGNFNYDNVTDFNDFLVLQNNFGSSLGGAAVPATAAQVAAMTAFAAAVPEPGMMGLLALGGLSLIRRRS